MAGLYHTLNVGAEALFATRQGVDTAGHNIANAQTEGFSRQRVELAQRDPSETRGVLIGNGVFVKTITRAHDQFIEKHLNETHQLSGRSTAYFDELKGIEDIYNPELTSTVADGITNFFNRVRELANFPDELTARTGVRESALSLAQSFHRVDSALKATQIDLNNKIKGEVDLLNTAIDNIAQLNVSIREMEAGEEKNANDLRDQQDRLVSQVAKSVGINYYRDEYGMLVLRGPDETLLVERGNCAHFEAQVNPDRSETSHGRFYDIGVVPLNSSLSRDATQWNTGGKLKAYFDVRDTVLEGLINQNNELASTLAYSVNAIHRQGFGLNNFKTSTGRDLFTISEDPRMAAETFELSNAILRSTDAISAAITPDAPADNVNLNDILRLENTKFMAGGNASFNDYYANMVGALGLEVVRAKNSHEADKLLLDDITSRKEAVSGVSMDEEATNLLKWQANFTASSRVITAIDEMLETVLNMKR